MEIKKWHVYLADLNPRSGTEPGKVRPVVVVQTDLLNPVHPSTVICPLTTNIQPKAHLLRVHLEAGEAGVNRGSDIMVDQIRWPVVWWAHLALASPVLAFTLGGGGVVAGPLLVVFLLRARGARINKRAKCSWAPGSACTMKTPLTPALSHPLGGEGTVREDSLSK